MSVAPGKDLDDTDATLALKQEAERVVKYFSEGGVWEEAFGSDVNEVDGKLMSLMTFSTSSVR